MSIAKVEALKLAQANTRLIQALIMDDTEKPPVKLSPTEQRIVNVIGHGKVPGKTIAKALGREGAGNSLWDLLAALVRHSILVNERGSDGYAVHPFWHHLIEEDEEEASEDGKA